MNVGNISFGPPMIRANLADLKSQTRRLVTVDEWRRAGCADHSLWEGCHDGRWEYGDNDGTHDMRPPQCRYGQPGDLLWVREAWRVGKGYHKLPGSAFRSPSVHYEADNQRPEWTVGRYRHARFMPRWASRMTLRITDVRVQRLQDISATDAKAEGLDFVSDGAAPWGVYGLVNSWRSDPRESYRALWESINGAGSWDANPWVWAISFDTIKENVDKVLAP